MLALVLRTIISRAQHPRQFGKVHARIREVEVQHYPRRYGHQTGASPRVILKAFKELFTLYGQLR